MFFSNMTSTDLPEVVFVHIKLVPVFVLFCFILHLSIHNDNNNENRKLQVNLNKIYIYIEVIYLKNSSTSQVLLGNHYYSVV
jgi:hypothetical protein